MKNLIQVCLAGLGFVWLNERYHLFDSWVFLAAALAYGAYILCFHRDSIEKAVAHERKCKDPACKTEHMPAFERAIEKEFGKAHERRPS